MSLKDLIIKETDFDEEGLKKILRPYVRILENSGKVRLTPKAYNLTIKDKILLYLLGKKAAQLLRMWNVEEESSPLEIENSLGVPGGSLRPNLMQLLEKGFVEKNGGKYNVPSYVIPEVQEYIDLDEEIPF